MKTYLLILFCFLTYSSFIYPQAHRALFVAVGEYPEGSGWAEIHAANDRELIVPFLQKNKFTSQNIQLLLNEKATKANIVAAFNKLRIQSSPGDYIYIHFSCHGQQMADDNGDEADGLDEALIPYNAQRRYNKGVYEGQNHLRDDELETLLNAIRSKIGVSGSMVVVLDACHSGTGTREGDDEEFIRGTSYVFTPDNYTPPTANKSALKTRLSQHSQMAPLTVFSACKDNEKNYEYYDEKVQKHYGSLTYALCRILDNNPATYTSTQLNDILINKMKIMFAKKRWTQTPFFESTHPNNSIKLWK
ncbi:caspase family protein [Bacteroides sp. 224]|uniref:caspase family protein n=1 Tax=Bacteroides sp. 224 TaxID=2302936 RepID=UPI0013D222EF|nr:caspase family protein [Bacteroides sp. 224]NDV66940.1 caspase family protein [Bacteroides sp. 224]